MDLERISAIKNVMKPFQEDSRYIVKESNSKFMLYQSVTGKLLAEFDNEKNNLIEHGFRSSFKEIERKIFKEQERLTNKISDQSIYSHKENIIKETKKRNFFQNFFKMKKKK